MKKIVNRFDNIYYKEAIEKEKYDMHEKIISNKPIEINYETGFSDKENDDKDEKIIISNKPVEVKYEIVSSDEENDDNEKDKRLIIILELVNKILYNIGKNTIADLTEFKLINKNDITKQKSTYIFMKKKIYLCFSKYNFKINKKNDNILHCLEKALESLNYKLICDHKFISFEINGTTYHKPQKFYSIKKATSLIN